MRVQIKFYLEGEHLKAFMLSFLNIKLGKIMLRVIKNYFFNYFRIFLSLIFLYSHQEGCTTFVKMKIFQKDFIFNEIVKKLIFPFFQLKAK